MTPLLTSLILVAVFLLLTLLSLILWLRHREIGSPSECEYTYAYNPDLGHPEPWRWHPRKDEFYHLPTELMLVFLDEERIQMIEFTEVEKQTDLEHSLLTEGLKEPFTVYVDENGKVRFQDGHHRLSIIRDNISLFPVVPVLLKRTSHIRAYGRTLHDECDRIFALLSKNR